jgi:hypothetical protein
MKNSTPLFFPPPKERHCCKPAAVSNGEGCVPEDRYLFVHFYFLLWGEVYNTPFPHCFRAMDSFVRLSIGL